MKKSYNLKIISSGDRLEFYKYQSYISENEESKNITGRKGKEEVSHEQKEFNKKHNRKITLTTCRNNIIRLIKANDDMQTFITLTFSKEVDYKESKKLLNNCFNKLRRTYKELKYLWVLEYGTKNKRLHYHLLSNIQLPKEIIFAKSNSKKSQEHKAYENEFNSRYWNNGFIDIRDLAQEGNTNIALYVSCYVVKDLLELELEGYRVYGYSRKTLNKPVEVKINNTDDIEQLLKQYEDYSITYSNSYNIEYKDNTGKNRSSKVVYVDLSKNN